MKPRRKPLVGRKIPCNHPVKTLFSYEEIDERCCELGAPEYHKTDDGEAWYWRFSGSELPVADTLAELLLAARSK